MQDALNSLRTKHPWPDVPPPVPEDWHGWLHPDTAAALVECLGPQTTLVVECGSWLGVSARAVLEHAPRATLIAIDHWRGSPEHQAQAGNADWARRLPTLYETFLRNLWPWRRRVVPLRADTLEGLAQVHEAGLVPGLVYLDSEHTLDRVSRELAFATAHWPQAAIVGDDFGHAPVRRAVEEHSAATGRPSADRGAAFLFPPWRRP